MLTPRVAVMICVLLACAALIGPTAAHQCVHDHIMSKIEADEVTTFAPTTARPSEEAYEAAPHATRHLVGTFGPIRIHFDTSLLFSDPGMMCTVKDQTYTNSLDNSRTALCSSADVLTVSKRDFLINTVLEEAQDHFTRALSVESVSGNLVLQEPDNAYCTYAEFVCCKKYMPAQAYNQGYANTDFVLFITGRPTGGSTIAWALTCQSDATSGRPLAGHANFGPALITTTTAGIRAQVATAIHEISHALGFSSDKFSQFRVPGTTTRRLRSQVIKSFTERGHTVSKIITENVVAQAKAQFDCPDWGQNAGGEVENGGAAGTVGSHWEKRVFMNEYMTGTLNSNLPTVYSAMTLALFEDSGWYQVDYSTAESLPWGNGEGCNFAENYCNTWSDAYFCKETQRQGCFPGLFYKGLCNLFDYEAYATSSGSNIPSYDQPFPDKPHLGGDSSVADYCPFYNVVEAAADCRESRDYVSAATGEDWGPTARCFTGSFWQTSANSFFHNFRATCLITACDALSNELLVRLRREPGKPTTYLDVTCPRAGGELDIGPLTNGEFTGTLNCPAAARICTGNPCDSNTCSGHGSCQEADGTCICASSYYGSDAYRCDQVDCPNSVGATSDCSGHGTCEHNVGQPTSGQCTCQAGFHGDTCEEIGCPNGPERTVCNNNNPPDCASSKQTCDGHGNCDTTTGICHCDSGYIGNACQLTDCPKSSAGVECSGHGTCDSKHGYCVCDQIEGIAADGSTTITQRYARSNCSDLVDGNGFTTLYFTGETPPANASVAGVSGSTGKVEAISFQLSPQTYTYFSFPVESNAYPMALELTYDKSKSEPEVVACYASNCPQPTLTSGQFFVSDSDKVNGVKKIAFIPEGGSPVASVGFDRVGTMNVAMISEGEGSVTVSLTRDPCGVLKCVHGTCRNQACQCDQPPTTSTGLYGGWSGTLCDVPACPGRPPCGDFKGECHIEDTTLPLRSQFPVCTCSEGFSGVDCGQTDTASFTSVNATLPVTQVGTVKVGKNDTYFFEAKAGDGVYVTLRSSSPNADPILLGQPGRSPQLQRDSSTAFAQTAWIQRSLNHTISVSVVSDTLYFVRVLNGRYATEDLVYTITFEARQGCPTLLNGCNGHGICNQVCRCDQGYEGIDCSIATPTLAKGQRKQLTVDVGQWKYFLYESSANATEVQVTLDSVAVSARAEPLLMVGSTSQRRANNLRIVTSDAALFDFDGYVNQAPQQQVLVRRRGIAYYYIGVHNTANSWAPIQVAVTVTEFKQPSFNRANCLASAASRAECSKAMCHGRGTYAEDAGSAFCVCQSGWFSDTFCNTPRFSSFGNLLGAAQEIGFLCNLCDFDVTLAKNGLRIYKIPQPLQKATGLQLTVQTANTTEQGNPSLLVSQYLPRSIVDFQFVSSSSASNESLTISDQSPTGRYWLAVYGNNAATYNIQASRKSLGGTTVLQETFLESLWDWVSNTQTGLVTCIVGGLVVACLCCCCVHQICTSGVQQTKKTLQHNISDLGHGVMMLRHASSRMIHDRQAAPRTTQSEQASAQLALQLAAIARQSREADVHNSPMHANPQFSPSPAGPSTPVLQRPRSAQRMTASPRPVSAHSGQYAPSPRGGPSPQYAASPQYPPQQYQQPQYPPQQQYQQPQYPPQQQFAQPPPRARPPPRR